MADEITATCGLRISNGGPVFELQAIRQQLDMSGTECVHNIQSIGTTEEALALGDLASCGWAIFKNLDTTNFVSLRPGTGDDNFVKILPGEVSGPFRLATSTPYAIADTSSVRLEYIIAEV